MSDTATNVVQPTAPAHGSAAEVKESITKNSRAKAPAPEVKPPAQDESAPKKTYKLKVDKQEFDVDEETYHAAAQRGYNVGKRERELVAKEKSAMEALKVAQEREEKYNRWQSLSPDQKVEQALTDLKDPNITKVAREKIERWLWGQIQADQDSPEQKELKSLKAEKESWENERKTQQEREKQDKYNKEKAQHVQTAQQDVIKIVELAGVPVTEHNFKLAADYLFINAKAKSGATPEQIAKFVKNDTIETTNHLYGAIAETVLKAREANDDAGVLKAGQNLLDSLPPQLTKALRIVDYVRHTKGVPQSAGQPVDVPKVQEPKKSGHYEFKTTDEWIEYRKKMVQDLDKSSKRV